MKKSLEFFVEHLKAFIEGKPKSQKPNPIDLKKQEWVNQIQQSLAEQTALHIIYSKKSFTGHPIRYDQTSQKLILKNFQQNLSVMIDLDEIDKISQVPKAISHSQKQGEWDKNR